MPHEAMTAIRFIQQLYEVEESLRHADEDEIAEVRGRRSREIVDEFFRWAHELLHSRLLLPSDPLTKALAYATERETGLRVFLAEPNGSSTRITSSVHYDRYRSGARTGCSAEPS